jgi:uncharacterized damage-inducible protein DinB
MPTTTPVTLVPESARFDLRAEALADVNATEKFFDRTLRCFDEADSLFRAAPTTYSVAAHVRHAARAIDWFREGALHDRWAMDFEEQIAEAHAAGSLEEAKADLALAFSRLREALVTAGPERLAERLPDNPILPGKPRFQVVSAVVDHTAHHRGALAVCARLLGKEPLMPYGED